MSMNETEIQRWMRVIPFPKTNDSIEFVNIQTGVRLLSSWAFIEDGHLPVASICHLSPTGCVSIWNGEQCPNVTVAVLDAGKKLEEMIAQLNALAESEVTNG